MGRIKELINKFIQPNETEKTFNELALASGLNEDQLKELSRTMDGVSWKVFSREYEEKEKKKAIKKLDVSYEKQEDTKSVNIKDIELDR